LKYFIDYINKGRFVKKQKNPFIVNPAKAGHVVPGFKPRGATFSAIRFVGALELAPIAPNGKGI